MWAFRPSDCDNEMPIDLRKKVVLQRDQARRSEDSSEPEDYSLSRRAHPPPILPVRKLSPFMSERYGGRCSLVTPEENRAQDLRNGSRGSLETAIRKLHFNSRLKTAQENVPEERCRSTNALPESKLSFAKENISARSSSCPDLTHIDSKPQPRHETFHDSRLSEDVHPYERGNDSNSDQHVFNRYSDSFRYSRDSYRDSPPILGGAKKRKSFVPIYGERAPSRQTKSPEHPPYDEYFSHPEILLRQQLQHQSGSPYLLHVYDYYQQLVQRLREHSTPSVRMRVPDSPTPTEEDVQLDLQRKRPCRALTGKHVKQGTGASISTLLTLRQKIQERQKAKEHQPRNILGGTNKKVCPLKKNNSKKAKQTTKNNKINNF